MSRETTWLSARVLFEDARYPTLVVEGPFGTRGYDVDRETGDLRSVCICHAYYPGECVCGYYDDACAKEGA